MILLLINVTIVSAIVAAAVLACRVLLNRGPSRLGYLLVVAAFAASLLLPVIAPRTAFVPASTGDASSTGLALHAIWLSGIAILGTMYAAAHVVSLRARRTWVAASDTLRRMLDWPDDVPLFETNDSFLATHGFVQPVVVANPAALQMLDAGIARRLARHELAHASWRDPLANALVRLTCIAFWPALPLWILERELRRLQELACDESALRGSDDASRSGYASALLHAARHRVRAAAVFASSGNDAGFDARVARVLEPRRRRPLAAAAAVLIVAAATIAAAPAQLPVRVSFSITPVENAPLTIEAAAMDIVAHSEADGQPLALPDLTLRNDTDSAISAFAFTVRADGRFVGAIREEIRLGPRGRTVFCQAYGTPPNLHIRNPRSRIRIELLKVEFADGRRWGF